MYNQYSLWLTYLITVNLPFNSFYQIKWTKIIFFLRSNYVRLTLFFAIHESPLASVPTSWSPRHRSDFTPASTRVSLIFAIFCARAGCNWRHCQGKNQEDRQKPFLVINQLYWLSKQRRERCQNTGFNSIHWIFINDILYFQ